tara:strand:+ start:816 stop:2003 length:1188 start_codon:yes stop_codon:yes gene_type:complete
LNNKEEKGKFFERKGFSKNKRPPGKLIWIHAASVGETLSALPLIDSLLSFSSDYNILLTTGTKTSKNLISERNLERVIHQYFPWDAIAYCDRFLNNWKPDIVIFLESEIWPNHLIQAKKRGIPILLVNARMTEKSKVRWLKFKKTINHLLSVFSLIISQDSTSNMRLKELGAKNTLTYGNLKHDSDRLPVNSKIFSQFETNSFGRNILVASSTHVGEEGRILKIFKSLLLSMPNLLLVLAPRHPDRRNDVINEIKKAGFFTSDFILRSNSLNFDKNTKIFILDSIGELGYFYKKSNSVILGGAFEKFGGHNPIEPARFGNAIFTGVNYYNFEEEYNNLVECNGAKVLKNDRDIEVIKDIDLVKKMALNSKNYSDSLGGVADKIILKIVGLLNENQ